MMKVTGGVCIRGITAIAVATATCAVSCEAQSTLAGTGVLEWQALTSTGWRAGAVAAESQTLHIRLVASWDVPTAHTYFNSTYMDVVVSNPGESDAIANQRIVNPPGSGRPPGVVTPMDGLLKIDQIGDVNLPGLGSGWIHPYQSIVDGYVLGTPLVLYDFDLTLSPSGGTRTVASVHRLLRASEPTRLMLIADFDSPTGTLYFVETQVRSLDILVPAPAGTLLLMAGALRGCARRRR